MILLQILDEGQLTDSHGRRVDFRVSSGTPLLQCPDKYKFSPEYNYMPNVQSGKRYSCRAGSHYSIRTGHPRGNNSGSTTSGRDIPTRVDQPP